MSSWNHYSPSTCAHRALSPATGGGTRPRRSYLGTTTAHCTSAGHTRVFLELGKWKNGDLSLRVTIFLILGWVWRKTSSKENPGKAEPFQGPDPDEPQSSAALSFSLSFPASVSLSWVSVSSHSKILGWSRPTGGLQELVVQREQGEVVLK